MFNLVLNILIYNSILKIIKQIVHYVKTLLNFQQILIKYYTNYNYLR